MLEDVGRIAGEDDTRRVAAAIADAEGAECCVKEGDIGACDGLGD